MVIFGTKATQVATEIIPYNCAHCGTQNSIQMTLLQKYAHIFWIPFIPIGKTAATQCMHCKQVLEKKEFSSYLQNSYDSIKSKSKIPIWTFSGLLLFAALIIVGGISSKQSDERNAKLIAEPKVGDIYEIKVGYKIYTLYKVGNIAGDTVFVLANQFETNKRRGLSDLKRKGDLAFINEPLPIHKADLKNMLEKREIVDIDRE